MSASARPILVPVDFSLCSDGVVHEAAQLARDLHCSLELLHVVDVAPGVPGETLVRAQLDGPVQSVDALRDAEARDAMPRYQRRALAFGVAARVVVRHGGVVDAILDEARRSGARLLVMGTHGRTGLSRLLMGSVAEQVLRRSEVPVMTVRSLHSAACEAGSCASCTSGRSAAADLVESEAAG